jgi:hypothetical protein
MLSAWQIQNYVAQNAQTYEPPSSFGEDLMSDNQLIEPKRQKPWLLSQLPVLRKKLISSPNTYERAIGLQLEGLHYSCANNAYEQEIFEIVAYELSNSILTKLDKGLISTDAMLIAMDDVAVQFVHSGSMASTRDAASTAPSESKRSGWDMLNDGVRKIGDAVRQLQFSY